MAQKKISFGCFIGSVDCLGDVYMIDFLLRRIKQQSGCTEFIRVWKGWALKYSTCSTERKAKVLNSTVELE